eukprot:6198424-Pleurochrysis_carterae.AAC.2
MHQRSAELQTAVEAHAAERKKRLSLQSKLVVQVLPWQPCAHLARGASCGTTGSNALACYEWPPCLNHESCALYCVRKARVDDLCCALGPLFRLYTSWVLYMKIRVQAEEYVPLKRTK